MGLPCIFTGADNITKMAHRLLSDEHGEIGEQSPYLVQLNAFVLPYTVADADTLDESNLVTLQPQSKS